MSRSTTKPKITWVPSEDSDQPARAQSGCNIPLSGNKLRGSYHLCICHTLVCVFELH